MAVKENSMIMQWWLWSNQNVVWTLIIHPDLFASAQVAVGSILTRNMLHESIKNYPNDLY